MASDGLVWSAHRTAPRPLTRWLWLGKWRLLRLPSSPADATLARFARATWHGVVLGVENAVGIRESAVRIAQLVRAFALHSRRFRERSTVRSRV